MTTLTDTMQREGGTSGAAAVVSGVAALIHEMSPNWPFHSDIEANLKGTARTVTASNCSVGCGAGLIDANAAVRIARYPVANRNYTNVNIADNTTTPTASSITLNGTGIMGTTARVMVEITHARVADLKVELKAPDGTVHLLQAANTFGAWADVTQEYSFPAAAQSKNFTGTWQLLVTDNVAGNTGYINAWAIRR